MARHNWKRGTQSCIVMAHPLARRGLLAIMATRKGYVLVMWTGCIENPRTGRPILFGTEQSASKYLARMPAWGRHAVSICACTTRPGSNGLYDYIVES